MGIRSSSYSRSSESFSHPSTSLSHQSDFFSPRASALLRSRRKRFDPDVPTPRSRDPDPPFSVMVSGSNSLDRRRLAICVTSFGYGIDDIDTLLVGEDENGENTTSRSSVGVRRPTPSIFQAGPRFFGDVDAVFEGDDGSDVLPPAVSAFSSLSSSVQQQQQQKQRRFPGSGSGSPQHQHLQFRDLALPDIVPREYGRETILEEYKNSLPSPEAYLCRDLDDIVRINSTSFAVLSRSFDEIRRLSVFDVFPPPFSSASASSFANDRAKRRNFRFDMMNGLPPRTDSDRAARYRLRMPAIACCEGGGDGDPTFVFSVCTKPRKVSGSSSGSSSLSSENSRVRRHVVVTDLASKRVSEAGIVDPMACTYRFIRTLRQQQKEESSDDSHSTPATPSKQYLLFLGGGDSTCAHFVCCDLNTEKVIFSSTRQDVQLNGVCQVDAQVFATGRRSAGGWALHDEKLKDVRLYDLRLSSSSSQRSSGDSSFDSVSFGDSANGSGSGFSYSRQAQQQRQQQAGVTCMGSTYDAARCGGMCRMVRRGVFVCGREDGSIWEVDMRRLDMPILRMDRKYFKKRTRKATFADNQSSSSWSWAGAKKNTTTSWSQIDFVGDHHVAAIRTGAPNPGMAIFVHPSFEEEEEDRNDYDQPPSYHYNCVGTRRLDETCSRFCFLGRGLVGWDRNMAGGDGGVKGEEERVRLLVTSVEGIGYVLRRTVRLSDGLSLRVLEWEV